MNALLRHIATALSGLALAVLAGYAVWGGLGLLAAAYVWLAGWLAYQFSYIFKLVRWLESPRIKNAPRAGGMWAVIFGTLLKQAKSRKKRKQKLASSLQRFNRAVEVMPNGVLILDQEGRVAWMNPLAAQHLNLSLHADWRGVLKEKVPAEGFADFIGSTPEAQNEFKCSLPYADGSGWRSLLLVQAAFADNEKLLISRDISESERLNAMRTAFVANVSHELRTPLTVINGFLETLADTPDLPHEQAQQFVGLMQKEGNRMQALLADLLTLSRLESGVRPEFSPLNLSALAAAVLADAETLSGGRHTFQASIEPDIWVTGAFDDLYTGLSNLAFNAVRYTQTGGEIRVALQAEPSEEGQYASRAWFAVSDNGPGIAPEHLPRLTERFYRVDKGRDRQSGGTGLGLAIVKHVLAEHAAVLQIESEVGRGSRFSAGFERVAKPL